MNKYLLMLVMLLMCSLASFAEVGDETPINAYQIVEIKQETTITRNGNERTEIVVIYIDYDGKKKLAYMTQTDYRKLQQAQMYGLDVEFVLVEMRNRVKLTIR